MLGAVRVGGPLTQAVDTVLGLARRLTFPLRRAALVHYGEQMLLGWLPRLIDGAVPTHVLAALEPATVKEVAFVLYRDMCRHHHRFLAPRAPDGWVDRPFAHAATQHDIVLPELCRFELEDPTRRGWARELGARIGIRGFRLFACHSSMVAEVIEQCTGCTTDRVDSGKGRS